MQFYEFTVRIPRPDRRWLRFSLRTALLSGLLCATFFGGMMIGIRYERNAGSVNRSNSPVAQRLQAEIAEMEFVLSNMSQQMAPSSPEIKYVEQQIVSKKAQLKQLR